MCASASGVQEPQRNIVCTQECSRKEGRFQVIERAEIHQALVPFESLEWRVLWSVTQNSQSS